MPTREVYFVDPGDYARTGDPGEIYIRKEMDGEMYDICNFSCDETSFPLDIAKHICNLLNNVYERR